MVDLDELKATAAALDSRLKAAPDGLHPFYFDQIKWLVEEARGVLNLWQMAVEAPSADFEPENLDKLDEELRALSDGIGLDDETAEQTIRRLANAVQSSAQTYVSSYAHLLRDSEPQIEEAMRTSGHTARTLRELLPIVSETLKVKKDLDKLALTTAAEADEVRKSLGERAELELASFFQGYAKNQSTLSWVFRAATGAFLAAVPGLTWWFYRQPAPDSVAVFWENLGLRVVTVATVLGLAVYLSKLASSHRRLADWASAMSVQLRTFSAFLTPVTDLNTQNQIYEEFARRVFGSPPSPIGDDAAVVPFTEVLALLSRARSQQ